MTRQQKQRTLAVLFVALALMVFGRHFLLRSGLSRAANRGDDGEAAAFSVVAPSLAKGVRTRILRDLRAHLEEGTDLEAVEDSARPGQRVVLISLTRAGQAALVAQAKGPSLGQALTAAAGLLASRATGAELREGRLRVDLAVSRSRRETFQENGHADLGDGGEGLWLPGPDLILLPEEIQSRRLVSSAGELRWPPLREYLAETGRQPPPLEENPAREGNPYFRVGFDSFMEGDDGLPVRLHPRPQPPSQAGA